MSGKAESKGKGTNIPKPFVDELTGIIQTVNHLRDNDLVTGARGQMRLTSESIELIRDLGFTLEDDKVLYKITEERLKEWKGEETFQRGDTITFGSAYIGQYKGKIPDWQGMISTVLCTDGFVKVEIGDRPTSKFEQKHYRNPLETTKAVTPKEPVKKPQKAQKKQTTTKKDDSKGDGSFAENVEGVINSLTPHTWGIRGEMFIEDETVIYNFAVEKTGDLPWITLGDKVRISKVYISDFKGEVKKWENHKQFMACKGAIIEIIEKAPLVEELDNPPMCYTDLEKTKVLATDEQLFENLTQKIEDLEEMLSQLKSMATVQKIMEVEYDKFLHTSTTVNLYHARMLAVILLITGRS